LQDYLIEILVCPACHAPLTWQIEERWGDRIETGAAACEACDVTYLILEGIGLFLAPERLQANADSDSPGGLGSPSGFQNGQPPNRQLFQYLRDHPDVERQLMFAPLQTLSSTDQFLRAALLEARGEYVRARTTENVAKMGLYTSAYLEAWDSQYEYIFKHLLGRVPSIVDGPMMDLACGRGYLLNQLALKFNHPIIAVDSNPFVLHRNRRWLEFFDLYDRVSLLAFDAYHMPFKDSVIGTIVTNLGLQAIAALYGIEESSALPQELYRVINVDTDHRGREHLGEFLAISHFYTEDDTSNGSVIQDLDLAPFLYKQALMESFKEADFIVSVENTQESVAKPMPSSDLIPSVVMDALPVAETVLEWGVVVAY
jgi:uncharacterized protein YbaR (Trm112 family)